LFFLLVGVEGFDEGSLVLGDGGLLSGVLSLFLLEWNLLLGWLFLSQSRLGRVSLLSSQQPSHQLLPSKRLRVRIQLDHEAQISQRVLLVHHVFLLFDLLSQVRLDLLRRDQSCQIRVRHYWSWKFVSNLEGRRSLVRAIKGREPVEGSAGPNHQTTQVTSWRQLQQIQTIHAAQLHSWKISEGTDHRRLLVIDDQGASSLSVSPVSGFALSSSYLSRLFHLLNVVVNVESLEDLDS